MNFFEILAAGASTVPVGGVILSLAAFAVVCYGVTLINRNVVLAAVLYGYVGNGLLLYGVTWTVHPDQPFGVGVHDLPGMAIMLVWFLALVGTASLLWALISLVVDEFSIDDIPQLSNEAAAYLAQTRAAADANATVIWPANTAGNAPRKATVLSDKATSTRYFSEVRGLDDVGERTQLINAGAVTGEQRQVRTLTRR